MKERDWIDYLQASAGPIIAIAGAYIAWQQHKLNQRKRKDDLFDRRYAFYERVVGVYTSTHPANHSEGVELEVLDVIDMAHEGRYLFGDEIHDLIMKLPEMTASNPFWADDAINRPFDKYLLFEEQSSWFMRKIKSLFAK